MGLFGFAGPGAGRGELQAAMGAIAGTTLQGPASFCHARHVSGNADFTVALEGGPVWLGGQSSSGEAALESIGAAYRSEGRDFLGKLQGRFALAIVDHRTSSVLLAVDQMGIERLCYAVQGDSIAFGSRADVLARTTGARLRPQAMFDYLLLHMVPSPHTVFEGVGKLRPGTCALFEKGTLRITRFWLPAFVEHGGRFEELKSQLLASLEAGVAACNPDSGTGSFLSGGLDSSTVSGMLGRVQKRSPQTFSIGFGQENYDEIGYARIANRHFNGAAHEYNVTADDIVTALPKIAGAYDEPFGNSSAVPTYFCAKLAADAGITHLLAGDGGDEIFGGNERYARHSVFEMYAAIPAVIRSGLLEPLTRGIDAENGWLPLRKLRSYIDQARIPMPERLESWNLMYRTDLGAMLEPEFRAAIEPRAPLEIMAEVFRAAPSRSLLNKMLFFDWHYTLADNDLRKVGTMCELAGMRVSYPMLDPRVIDVSVRVPPAMKMKRLELRTFYKQALTGFLPEEILRKQKHGFGLPFGEWLKTHAPLAELIYALLSDLKSRGIVRAKFLDDLIEGHRTGHPGYFGYAIWDLAMLEAWLKVHAR